jgi:hypothetical protein
MLLLAVVAAIACACSGTPGQPGPHHGSPTTPPSTSSAEPTQPPAASDGPALVWSPREVPARVVNAADHLTGAAAVVTVANGTAWLPSGAPPGMAFPIDVSAADPHAYAAAVPTAPPVLAHLQPGQVVLAADEARLRGLRVGDPVELGGERLQVAGIVDDAVIGDVEMFVTPADAHRLHLPGDRYLLVLPKHASDWPAIAARLRRVTGGSTPLRLRPPGTARVLHQADAVLTPLEEKLRFGEFAADPRPSPAGYLQIDPRWRATHLATEVVPILGAVTCNTAFLSMLRTAMRDVIRRGLQGLVNPSDYGGCFAPRLIPGVPGESISHHAFGAAIDLNVSQNPQGQPPHQDPRLVRIFARAGLTWGGRWLVPDGMHFEALDPP